jgi:hypothetical protein
VLEIDYPTLTLTDPDEVSVSFVSSKPKNNKAQETSISSTMSLLESLSDDVD